MQESTEVAVSSIEPHSRPNGLQPKFLEIIHLTQTYSGLQSDVTGRRRSTGEVPGSVQKFMIALRSEGNNDCPSCGEANLPSFSSNDLGTYVQYGWSNSVVHST